MGERARHLPRRPKSGSGSTENRPACNCDAPFLRTERFLCRDARVRALICAMRLAAARPRKPTLFSTVISSISRLIALLDSVHLRDLRTNERVRRSLSIREPDRARATAAGRRLLTSPERHAAVLTARARSPRLHSRHHDERLGGTRPVRGRASARRLFSRREARRRRGREARRGAHRPLPDASLHRRPRRRAVVGRSRGGPQSGVRSATPRFGRDPIASDAATAIPDPPPAAKTPRQHFIGGPRQRLSRERFCRARHPKK